MAKLSYRQLNFMWRNRDMIFNGYNSADGTASDNTTDPVITRNPNDYVLPRITSMNVAHGLLITVGVLAVIILIPMAVKTLKQLKNV